MTVRAKDLTPDQRLALESLLGRAIGEYEVISIQTSTTPPAPDWLKKSWESAREHDVDQLSAEEIDAEIAAARKSRRGRGPAQR